MASPNSFFASSRACLVALRSAAACCGVPCDASCRACSDCSAALSKVSAAFGAPAWASSAASLLASVTCDCGSLLSPPSGFSPAVVVLMLYRFVACRLSSALSPLGLFALVLFAVGFSSASRRFVLIGSAWAFSAALIGLGLMLQCLFDFLLGLGQGIEAIGGRVHRLGKLVVDLLLEIGKFVALLLAELCQFLGGLLRFLANFFRGLGEILGRFVGMLAGVLCRGLGLVGSLSAWAASALAVVRLGLIAGLSRRLWAACRLGLRGIGLGGIRLGLIGRLLGIVGLRGIVGLGGVVLLRGVVGLARRRTSTARPC